MITNIIILILKKNITNASIINIFFLIKTLKILQKIITKIRLSKIEIKVLVRILTKTLKVIIILIII